MPKTSVSQKVKQNQKVVVNVGSVKPAKKKSKKRPKSAPAAQSAAPYVRYPNSIGYALNSQVYSLPAPKTFEYNSALAGMQTLQAQQMNTGSLIPNQQVNSLYSTIRATPRQESLGDNPFTRVSRNTQPAMLDQYEGVLEHIIKDNTTPNAYDPDPNGQISVGVGQTLGDLPAGIVQVGANEELLLQEMSKGLKGDTRSLGDRQSVASQITQYPQLSQKAYSDSIRTLNNYDDANLEESLGKSTKKQAAMGAVIGFPSPYFTPEKSPSKRGRPKGSSNKKVILGGIEMDEI
jgi:hypothetical protein